VDRGTGIEGVGEEDGPPDPDRPSTRPVVKPEGRTASVAHRGNGDAAVEGQERGQMLPVLPGLGVASDVTPRPTWPRRVRSRPQPVHKLELQALVFCCETFDAETTFRLGATHCHPGHEAFGTRDSASHIPQEGTTQSLDRAQQDGRELQRSHGECGDGV
jgi:hypothetical protein